MSRSFLISIVVVVSALLATRWIVQTTADAFDLQTMVRNAQNGNDIWWAVETPKKPKPEPISASEQSEEEEKKNVMDTWGHGKTPIDRATSRRLKLSLIEFVIDLFGVDDTVVTDEKLINALATLADKLCTDAEIVERFDPKKGCALWRSLRNHL